MGNCTMSQFSANRCYSNEQFALGTKKQQLCSSDEALLDFNPELICQNLKIFYLETDATLWLSLVD